MLSERRHARWRRGADVAGADVVARRAAKQKQEAVVCRAGNERMMMCWLLVEVVAAVPVSIQTYSTCTARHSVGMWQVLDESACAFRRLSVL